METTDSILIGVDGGGSGCRVTVRLPDGRKFCTAGGPANVTSDRDQALHNVLTAVRHVLGECGLQDAAAGTARAHLGLAGVLDDSDAADVRDRFLRNLPLEGCTVSDDRTTQAFGMLQGHDGFVVAVGTGSTVARVVQGRVRGVGGWGLVLGDEASGAWLGRAALSRCLTAADGMSPASDLTRALTAEFDGPAGIVRFARHAAPHDFAALAPRIVANDSDPVAATLLAKGAAYLDRALTALGFVAGARLCLSGGLGATYAARLSAVRSADMTSPRGDALDGALLLAKGQGA